MKKLKKILNQLGLKISPEEKVMKFKCSGTAKWWKIAKALSTNAKIFDYG